MIQLRPLKIEELDTYKYWKLPIHKYHSLNGPYFKKSSEEEIDQEINNLRKSLENTHSVLENKRMIINGLDSIIGEVSYNMDNVSL